MSVIVILILGGCLSFASSDSHFETYSYTVSVSFNDCTTRTRQVNCKGCGFLWLRRCCDTQTYQDCQVSYNTETRTDQRCQQGWSPPNTCDTPVCSCVGNSYCTAPNTCTCNNGWTDLPTCYTPVCSCVGNSRCTAPNTCTCYDGWTGLPNCNTPVCTTCVGRSYCSAPNTCTCNNGWSGLPECNTPVCSSGCGANQYCSSPGTCSCTSGWTNFPACNTPTCFPSCTGTHQICSAPNTCSCATGWQTYPACDSPICNSPSCTAKQVCTAPNTCSCQTGWTNFPTCNTPTCNPSCTAKQICSAPNYCSCITGWQPFPSCDTAICDIPCAAKQVCIAPNNCSCQTGWTNFPTCNTPVCTGGCGSNQTCTAPENCSCVTGWTRFPFCDTAICNTTCPGNEICTSPEICSCQSGWSPAPNCLTPICNPTCTANQTCLAPNLCICRTGWTNFPACDIPKCTNPTCSEKQVCSAPNTCSCPNGWQGFPDCTTPVCLIPCSGGRVCSAPNICTAVGTNHTDATDPCVTAINIGDYRRSTAYVPSGVLLQDTDLDSNSWYRFDSCTGSKMPESCVEMFHCGTFAAVWMNGIHPTAADPGPKSVPVCAQYYPGNCCGWSSQINVKRCLDISAQEYFVYQLQPTPEDVAYCAGTGLGMDCGNGSAWNAINSTCTAVPVRMNNPTLGTPYISGWKLVPTIPQGSKFNATRFSINCNIGYPKQTTDDGVRFEVSFEADGVIFEIFTATSTNPVVALDESYLNGHLGKLITCSVRSYISINPCAKSTMSISSLSNGFWLGVQPVNSSGSVVTTVMLQQGQNFTFRMRPTFPVTFAHCFSSPIPCYPYHQFQLNATAQKAYDCSFLFSAGANISVPITVTPITVTVMKRNIIGRIEFLNVDTFWTTIFQNYKIQGIQVQIYDPLPQPSCMTQGDPHISVFGASSYYDIFLVGDFYLLKAKERLMEIQVRFIPWSSSGRCNCGVIVREGNNILGINACDNLPSPLVLSYLVDANFPPGTIEWTGNSWTINLISGIKLSVLPWNNNLGGICLNIEVFGLNSENYDGLCSNTTNSATVFESLRVPESKSFFRFNSTNRPTCASNSSYIPVCNCTGKNDSGIFAQCNQTLAQLLESVNILLSGYSCPPGTRRKRSSALNGVDTIDLDSISARMNHTSDSLVANVNLVWPTASGITKQQATNQCNSVLRSSPAFQTCSGVFDPTPIINTCVTDIQLMDKLSAVTYAAAILEQACVYTMKSQITETANGVDAASAQMLNTLNQVQNSICPFQCSGRGTCSNQKCTCNSGYLGVDCSLTQGQQPIIKGMVSAKCDIRQNPCRTIYVEAVNVLNSPNLVCTVQPLGVCTGGQYSYQQTLNGSYSPYGPVLCTALMSPVSYSLDNGAAIYVVSISLSNDRTGWSNSMTYTVYDSNCMTCNDNGCQKKSSISDPIEAQRCNRAISYGTQCTFDYNGNCVPNNCTRTTSTIPSFTIRSTSTFPSTSTTTSMKTTPTSTMTTTTTPSTTTLTTTTIKTTTKTTTNSQRITPTLPTSTTTSATITGCWDVYYNSNSPGGRLQPYTTLLDCQRNCYLVSCFGFDWNPQNPSGQQCWFSGVQTINRNAYPGCTHFQSKSCF